MINLINLLNSVVSIILVILLIFIFLEILLKVIKFLKNKIYYEHVGRKDFINKEYHDYLDWIESLDKPMFKYLPIGIRFFNHDNHHLKDKVLNNSHGFRTYEFSKKKDDELRVILLGGSTAWGCGSSSNATNISGYLEKFINNDKKLLRGKTSSKVFNLSQVNGTQTQDILTLVFYALSLKPDIVITFTGWNEIITNYRLNDKVTKKHNVFYLSEMEDWEPTQLPKVKKKFVKQFVKEWFLNELEITKLFFKNSQKAGLEIVDKISQNINLNSSIFIRNLEIIDKISQGSNFKTYHFLQPHIYRKLNLTEAEKKVADLYEKYRPIHGGKKFASFLKNTNIYDEIYNNLPNTKFKIKNLIDIFKNENRSIFFTLVHLNNLGYKLIAQEIYDYLIQNTSHIDNGQINVRKN